MNNSRDNDEMTRLYDIYKQKKDYISISKTGIIGDITPSQMSTATQFALSNLIQSLKHNLPYLQKDLHAYLAKFSKNTYDKPYENTGKILTKEELTKKEEEEQKKLDNLLKQQFGPHTPLSETNMNLALNAYTASQTNPKSNVKPNNKTTYMGLLNRARGLAIKVREGLRGGGSMSKKKRKKRKTKRRK